MMIRRIAMPAATAAQPQIGIPGVEEDFAGPGLEVTLSSAEAVAVCFDASVTVTPIVKVPVTVGVQENMARSAEVQPVGRSE
jgi:hypothetical protein